VVMSLQREWLR